MTKMADVKERFLKDGAETVASTPQEFLETIKIDIEKWGKVVAATGARVD